MFEKQSYGIKKVSMDCEHDFRFRCGTIMTQFIGIHVEGQIYILANLHFTDNIKINVRVLVCEVYHVT